MKQYRGGEYVGRRGGFGDDGKMDDWLEVGIVYDRAYRRIAGSKSRAYSKIKSAVKYMRSLYRRELCLDVKLVSVLYMDPYPFSTRHRDTDELLDNFINYFSGRRERTLRYPDVVSTAFRGCP